MSHEIELDARPIQSQEVKRDNGLKESHAEQSEDITGEGVKNANSELPATTSANLERGFEGESGPINETHALQQWNKPRINLWRYLATLLGFVIMGMNDAAIGALIPYLETYYSLSYSVVSLVFLAPFVGYTAAAMLNNSIHMKFGQRGIAFIAPVCRIAAYTITCNHPPYAVIPIVFIVAGFGNGLEDGGYNAWIGNMSKANELLGVLHACYGLGATISPLIATTMVTKDALPWYKFYYVMIGITALELVIALSAFWTATGSAHRLANPRSNPDNNRSRTIEALKNRISWICALFLLGYVGVEVSIGGWVVTFMLRVRNGTAYASGIVETGFWLGVTMGRLVLGFVTGRIGEKLAIVIYLVLSMGLELLFWLVPSFLASAVMASLLGFFLAPMFPAAVVVATKLLPRYLHVSAIGFAAAFGGGGAALFPFAVGAIAQVKGVQVLQPIVLALLAVILVLWCVLPGGFGKKGLDKASEDISNGETPTNQIQWIKQNVATLRKRIGIV